MKKFAISSENLIFCTNLLSKKSPKKLCEQYSTQGSRIANKFFHVTLPLSEMWFVDCSYIVATRVLKGHGELYFVFGWPEGRAHFLRLTCKYML